MTNFALAQKQLAAGEKITKPDVGQQSFGTTLHRINQPNNSNDMGLQIIQDSKGKATGVYIPISQWKELKKHYKDLESLEYEEPTKEQILQELKEAVKELKLVEQGKLKARPAKELLDEL